MNTSAAALDADPALRRPIPGVNFWVGASARTTADSTRAAAVPRPRASTSVPFAEVAEGLRTGIRHAVADSVAKARDDLVDERAFAAGYDVEAMRAAIESAADPIVCDASGNTRGVRPDGTRF